MKTILVTTCWLDTPDFLNRTNKWLDYYQWFPYDIALLDNASSFENIGNLNREAVDIFQRFHVHMPRKGIWDYPYLWRAVHFFPELFKEYDKVIYTDNDFFLISENAIKYVDEFNKGWASFWCKKHNFPETGIQIVTKDCEEYKQFTKGTLEEFIAKNNGKEMERLLPLTNINRDLNGDRHSEYGITEQQPGWDFTAQCLTDMKVIYNL